ncbi:MAG TPA: FAD-dependent monooxygenase [Steroidobacteraceae bacterium]|nr:FAD-dependent monooxygenase [Steroidobacteraceae bacterium]
MNTDVLIVGAGPTGLMLANQLARRGVRPLIIDRHPGPSLQTRALGVQARTLEIYAKLGLADRAIELGKRGNGAHLWSEGRQIGAVSLGDAGSGATPYPYILVLGQDDNERIMGDKLREFGVDVQWNTALLSIEQHASHVVATLRQPNGELRRVEAAWVAGCDGAHSAVRALNGIAFPGAPYEHVFFVADVTATGNMVPDEVNVFLWRAGFHLFFPMRGQDHWRIVGIVPPQLRDQEGLEFAAIMPSLSSQAGASLSIKACSWFSTYRIHHRAAERFRDRRCFVLGDAAHVHSPVGAQGMNTGLQDAYNLAWKLALVVQGKADATLLDSYAAERQPVAQRLLDTTDRGFRLVVSDSWLAGLFRTQVLARIAAFAVNRPRVQRLAFRTVSQTGIHYRGSPLSVALGGLGKQAPQAGDRFPWMKLQLEAGGAVQDLFQALDDTRFNLLVFGQQPPALADSGGLVQVHSIPITAGNEAEQARVHVPRAAFYLLRPDGHVGLCGETLEAAALRQYFSGNLAFVTSGTSLQYARQCDLPGRGGCDAVVGVARDGGGAAGIRAVRH